VATADPAPGKTITTVATIEPAPVKTATTTVASAAPAPAPAGDEPPPPEAGDKPALLGTWKATRADGSTFTLILAEDRRFTWVYSRLGTTSTITGTYTLDEKVLTMNDPQRGAMAGEVALGNDSSFTFQMAGLPANKGTLTFRR
jgi:hypothetical protein